MFWIDFIKKTTASSIAKGHGPLKDQEDQEEQEDQEKEEQ